ncbi:MAG: hypothetical protein ABUT39_02200 [Acidobacteriota bacterium]
MDLDETSDGLVGPFIDLVERLGKLFGSSDELDEPAEAKVYRRECPLVPRRAPG